MIVGGRRRNYIGVPRKLEELDCILTRRCASTIYQDRLVGVWQVAGDVFGIGDPSSLNRVKKAVTKLSVIVTAASRVFGDLESKVDKGSMP